MNEIVVENEPNDVEGLEKVPWELLFENQLFKDFPYRRVVLREKSRHENNSLLMSYSKRFSP